MTSTLLNLYKSLVATNAIMHAVRNTKSGALINLFATEEEAAAAVAKGQSAMVFEPTDEEGALIDMVCPAVQPKADPMANRLRKSEFSGPVKFVKAFVMANPDMDRKEQIAYCVSQGVADYTARTQVQVARKILKERAEAQAQAAAEAETETADEGSEE